jgi:hypothetical protein
LLHPTSSTTSKVFLDTCILVSASVYGSYKDLGIQSQHDFYLKTVPLFDIIKRYVEKRIGIITFTIETQALGVIARAVADQLEETAEKLTDPELKAKIFESHAVFFDQCLAHLQENLAVLQREPVSQTEVERYYPEVSVMYNNLRDIAKKLDIDQLINANVTQRYQKTIRYEVHKQYEKRYKQLLKLKNEPVEESDKRILCEAISLLKIYQKTDVHTKMYLSSTDYHFSPSDSGGEIAEQISKQFHIVCDWPDKIAKRLKTEGYT